MLVSMKFPILTAFAGLALGLFTHQSVTSNVDDPVADAVFASDRPADDLVRDATRQPARVLDFFDIKRGMVVADFVGSGGYYTELLSRAVGPDGHVYLQNPPELIERFMRPRIEARLADGRLENVTRLDEELDGSSIPDASLDAAILVRFYHDFGHLEVDRAAFNAMVFDKLKPGGVFGVVDHHAKPGAGLTVGLSLHRIDEDLVQYELEQAGFVLEAKSFVLEDATDTLDWNIFDPDAAGRDTTSRFVHLYRRPPVTPETPRPDEE